jgi:hypothetical protein
MTIPNAEPFAGIAAVLIPADPHPLVAGVSWAPPPDSLLCFQRHVEEDWRSGKGDHSAEWPDLIVFCACACACACACDCDCD